jgi:hypothetical protein
MYAHSLRVFALLSVWWRWRIKYHASISTSIIMAQKTRSECKDRECGVIQIQDMCVAYFLCGIKQAREKN